MMSDSAQGGSPMPRITRLIGVYDADGGLLGELRYVAGKVFRGRHCALCDVTHSSVRRRPEWDRFVERNGVDWDLLHLNERPAEVVRACNGQAPCVLAQLADGTLLMLLDADALEAASNSIEQFEHALRARCEELGLTVP